MIPRRAKRDISEPEIVSALLKAGCSVYRLHQPVDLLVGFRGKNYLAECKTGKAKPNKNQKDFAEEWRGLPYVVLTSAQDAFDWIAEIAAA